MSPACFDSHLGNTTLLRFQLTSSLTFSPHYLLFCFSLSPRCSLPHPSHPSLHHTFRSLSVNLWHGDGLFSHASRLSHRQPPPPPRLNITFFYPHLICPPAPQTHTPPGVCSQGRSVSFVTGSPSQPGSHTGTTFTDGSNRKEQRGKRCLGWQNVQLWANIWKNGVQDTDLR